MRDGAEKPWRNFRAKQTIELDTTGFAWRARTGPFGLITVTDALDRTGPSLTVMAIGLIRVAHVDADDALRKGELQRYLAELPLAPDAILRNRSLDWEVLGPSVLRVAVTHGRVRAFVDLTLGKDGLVVSAFAPDRPRLEGCTAVERPWTGRFSDYRSHQRCIVPFSAEVAWTIDGQEAVVWRGKMTKWGRQVVA